MPPPHTHILPISDWDSTVVAFEHYHIKLPHCESRVLKSVVANFRHCHMFDRLIILSNAPYDHNSISNFTYFRNITIQYVSEKLFPLSSYILCFFIIFQRRVDLIFTAIPHDLTTIPISMKNAFYTKFEHIKKLGPSRFWPNRP